MFQRTNRVHYSERWCSRFWQAHTYWFLSASKSKCTALHHHTKGLSAEGCIGRARTHEKGHIINASEVTRARCGRLLQTSAEGPVQCARTTQQHTLLLTLFSTLKESLQTRMLKISTNKNNWHFSPSEKTILVADCFGKNLACSQNPFPPICKCFGTSQIMQICEQIAIEMHGNSSTGLVRNVNSLLVQQQYAETFEAA